MTDETDKPSCRICKSVAEKKTFLVRCSICYGVECAKCAEITCSIETLKKIPFMVCKPCVLEYRKVEEESIAPQDLANDKLIVKIKETEDYLDKRELVMTKKIDLLSDSNEIIQSR